jgi:hypothetical protein
MPQLITASAFATEARVADGRESAQPARLTVSKALHTAA